MTRRRRPKLDRTLREENKEGEIWRLYVEENWSQTEIAEEMGLTQQRISQILARLRKEILPETRDEIIRRRADQINVIVKAVISDARTGDKDAVSSLVKLWEREAKLLGLDAPTKQEIKGRLARYDISGVHLDDLT